MKKIIEAIKVSGKGFGRKALVIGGIAVAALAIGAVVTRSNDNQEEELTSLDEAACASEEYSEEGSVE